jgi:hypothetical protein
MIVNNRKAARVPVCVVFTGDLTSSGKRDEFWVGSTFLREAHSIGVNLSAGFRAKELAKQMTVDSELALFVIPGNHDIWQRDDPEALSTYRDNFPGSFPKTFVIETCGRPIVLYGLDSTPNTPMRHKLARGKVPELHVNKLCEMVQEFKSLTEHDAIHIVCLHHLLLSNENCWDPTLELDDRAVIASRLLETGADLVLAGHVHLAITREEGPNTPNHAVASTATQQFSGRGFFVLDIYEEEIGLVSFAYDEKRREFVLDEKEEDIKIRNFRLHPGKAQIQERYEAQRKGLDRLLQSISKEPASTPEDRPSD